MSEEAKLLPCPFCGDSACFSNTEPDTIDGRWKVVCNNDGCWAESKEAFTKEEATRLWNLRSGQTPPESGRAQTEPSVQWFATALGEHLMLVHAYWLMQQDAPQILNPAIDHRKSFVATFNKLFELLTQLEELHGNVVQST